MSNAEILAPVTCSKARLPFYSARVPAGFPSPAQDHIEKTISLDALLDIDAPQTYLVRAHGDSMIGVGIFDGDILVVSRGVDARSGDIVIAAINGDTFVKRFTRAHNQVVLLSENPIYAARFIMEGDELLIWGVVMNSIRQHCNHG
ncbi:translesion error-prone DNA polymerase V autoproteolytic subunit (plasmid) [Halopseudomonas sp. SMJS2]|uniref:LexA family protein n=1 Tax=Halopseudomonas sp. SMJS2 TaxID=3041098 RepID=UPI002452DA7C|nr:translesion error-prone DNA polymerase V autoproteolytic subunit [Halopseudomonas sp. SMJS2]WGK63499.1 translesion error-prone DNA polymerase V autoproteolytic subunit [Halopseudomonas sp. SMJS2]